MTPKTGVRGLGLGVFIARTLLERTGAKVTFTNRIFPDHGAVVQIAWPRSRVRGWRNRSRDRHLERFKRSGYRFASERIKTTTRRIRGNLNR